MGWGAAYSEKGFEVWVCQQGVEKTVIVLGGGVHVASLLSADACQHRID